MKKKDNYLNDIDQELNRALKQCVEHHLKILAILKRLEKLFHPLLLVKALQVTLFLCMVAFTAGSVSIKK